jgi:hypothetical protein
MGIVHGLSNEEYHATAGVSSSAVKTVAKKSVAHWKGQKMSQTAAFRTGTSVHALLLEEDRDLVIKGPKTRSSLAFKDMEADLQDEQILLTEVEYNVAHCIARGALKNPHAKAALRNKDRLNEVSIFADCPRTGLAVKVRPDLAILSKMVPPAATSEGILYDVKTTQDASPKGFASETFKYAYHLQAAFYLYVCNLAGWEVSRFKFICVEKTAPFVCHIFEVGPELLAKATEQMHQTLDIIAAAEKNGDYGTGWGECTTLKLPAWL